MKQRVSSLDLQLIYGELKPKLEGFRLSNIYNIADSSRQFLLKFNKPDSKLNVVIDCGLRIHLTEFNRPVPPTPSGFVVKLRKHLKSKRLTTVKRVANDRILVLSFGDGQFFLVLEFFSAGNVILLDSDRKIIALQRIVHEHENKVGQTYDMFDETFLQDTAIELPPSQSYSSDLVTKWFQDAKDLAQSTVQSGKTGKASKLPSIHKLLFLHEPHLSSDLISRNLKTQGIAPNASCLDFEDRAELIANLLTATENEVASLMKSGCKAGFIVSKRNPLYDAEKGDSSIEFVYEQFHPFAPFSNDDEKREVKVIEIAGDYNETVDEFYSTIESSKYALRIQNQEHHAKKRLHDAKLDNDRRIQALVDVQTRNETRGHTIIFNADLVEEAQNAVKSLVEQQMDWKTIEMLILNEQKKGNEIAKLIKLPLDLQNNKIGLELLIEQETNDDTSSSDSDTSSDSEDSSDSESSDSLSDFEADEDDDKVTLTNKGGNSSASRGRKPKPTIDVVVDLSLSAYANASNYFDIKKSTMEKQKKVEQNANKALKNIELRIERDLKKKLKETHDVLNRTRTPYFFEKYNWFISSEGFLVLMGKSGQETDQIFSRYIQDNDVLVSNSFDIHVWIKNPNETEIPPNTLMQAGIMCMSASPAWSKKIQSSAWWCFARNVSKFDSFGGDVLPPGSFQLKNDKMKSFLPPSPLVMGFAFLWKTAAVDAEEGQLRELEEKALGEDEEALGEDEELSDGPAASEHRADEVENTAEKESNIQPSRAELEEVPSNDPNDESPDDDSESQIRPSAPEEAVMGTSAQNKKVRGKKGKLKKMQRKYADQDEEERRLRLEVLGTLKGVEKQRSKEEEEKMKQQEREQKKLRRERQKKQQSLKFDPKEKVKVDYHKLLSELSPAPVDENVKDIVPVFAPWTSLNKYKYKVKIQPGNAKKTKTLHEILYHFLSRKLDETSTDKELDWPCEHEQIKALKDVELVSLIYTDKLKATIPGQNDSKGKSKGDGKGKGKKKGSK
ncbi:LAME_0A03422g1_1 [Lachancea meyersii CBS 8951]|uniref:Ribosome quality control complex subunit 2 n=1 Tax=Lachancea meyersii CBS 8951 TaxID=1266667 RepID=A0A1G4INR3_9SACH|nr:LAME_0A03422g1_1 [Lachancea meyersii CBS 8951]